MIILLSICSSALMYLTFKDTLPKGASKAEWERFVLNIFQNGNDKFFILGSLMIMHVVHVLCCFPFVNITQTLYAYMFGFFAGTFISFAWESLIVTLYTIGSHYKSTYTDVDMDKLVSYLTKQKITTSFIFLFQSSSVPINAQILAIGYGDVTVKKYLCVYYVSALINSVKNCMVGEFIRTSDMDKNTNVEIVGAFIIFVVTVPTLVSIFIWNGTYNFYHVPASDVQDGKQVLAEDKSPENSKQENENNMPQQTPDVENETVSSTDTTENIDITGSEVHWTKYFFKMHPAYITSYIMRRHMISKKPQMQEEEIHLMTSVAQPLLQSNTSTHVNHPTFTVYNDKSHCEIIHKRPELPKIHIGT